MEKLNWNILPLPLLEPVVEVLQSQAKGRGDFGWVERPVEEHIAALLRHVADYQGGCRTDHESNKPTAAHIACRALMILGVDLYKAGKGLYNEVFKEQGITDEQK